MRRYLHALIWLMRHKRGQYHVKEADAVCEWLPQSGIAIDVGAHAGSWTVPLGRCLRRGHVVAVEALPYYAGILRILLPVLGLRNARVLNMAVTRSPGPVRIVWKDPQGRRLTGLTHLASPGEDSGETVEVRGGPLDEMEELHGDRIVFLKVDVEGAELGVFEGGRRLIERDRPIVYSEISPGNLERYGNKPVDIFFFFESQNYRKFVFDDDGGIVSFDRLEDTGRNDVLFVPAERVRSVNGREQVASLVEASSGRQV